MMHDENSPPAFRKANETMQKIADAITGDAQLDVTTLPDSHKLAWLVVKGAMVGHDKRQAVDLLTKATMAERKEVAAFFALMSQFSRQVMEVCTSAAVKMEDEYVVVHGDKTGTMNLGDPLPEGYVPKPDEIDDQTGGLEGAPPEVQLLAALAKTLLGNTVDVELISAKQVQELRRLQDDYSGDEEPGDPIKSIARRLSRMPGSKRPKLPPKKLPEC